MPKRPGRGLRQLLRVVRLRIFFRRVPDLNLAGGDPDVRIMDRLGPGFRVSRVERLHELVEIGASLLQEFVVSGIQALIVGLSLSERNGAHAKEHTREREQSAKFHTLPPCQVKSALFRCDWSRRRSRFDLQVDEAPRQCRRSAVFLTGVSVFLNGRDLDDTAGVSVKMPEDQKNETGGQKKRLA